MKSNKQVIGMLHVPINTILSAPAEWRRQLNLPDGRILENRHILSKCAQWDKDTPFVDPLATENVIENLKRLTFYGYLRDRMFREAWIYRDNGIRTFMLENIGAPYFMEPDVTQSAIFAVMMALAQDLRIEYGNGFRIGLQILSYSDPLAMSAACFCGLDFIRSEGSLFAGERPEGVNRNHGTLARLYLQREEQIALLGRSAVPRIYVDVQKKHTVFSQGLQTFDSWLDNVVFEKLEGVVVTGTGTGVPVKENDLAKARQFIDAATSKPYFPHELEVPLIAGSGVDANNAGMYRKYVDAVIVGSTLKEYGYWECSVDPERVAKFTEAWYK